MAISTCDTASTIPDSAEHCQREQTCSPAVGSDGIGYLSSLIDILLVLNIEKRLMNFIISDQNSNFLRGSIFAGMGKGKCCDFLYRYHQ